MKPIFPTSVAAADAVRSERQILGRLSTAVSRRTLGRVGARGMILTDALAQRAGGRCGWMFDQYGTEVRITWPIAPSGQEITT